jgi:hypothetical protein
MKMTDQQKRKKLIDFLVDDIQEAITEDWTASDWREACEDMYLQGERADLESWSLEDLETETTDKGMELEDIYKE